MTGRQGGCTTRRHTVFDNIMVVSALTANLLGCRSRDSGGGALPTHAQREDVGVADEKVVDSAGLPDAEALLDPETASIQAPRESLPVGAYLYLRAEAIEADTIIVGHLRAISVEATEIRAKSVHKSKGIAAPKDLGMNLLQGDVVEGDSIDVHHARARLIIADSIDALSVSKPHAALEWANSGDGGLVRNQCTALGRPERRANCGQWR